MKPKIVLYPIKDCYYFPFSQKFYYSSQLVKPQKKCLNPIASQQYSILSLDTLPIRVKLFYNKDLHNLVMAHCTSMLLCSFDQRL